MEFQAVLPNMAGALSSLVAAFLPPVLAVRGVLRLKRRIRCCGDAADFAEPLGHYPRCPSAGTAAPPAPHCRRRCRTVLPPRGSSPCPGSRHSARESSEYGLVIHPGLAGLDSGPIHPWTPPVSLLPIVLFYVTNYDQTLPLLLGRAIWDKPLLMDGARAEACLSERIMQPRAFRNSLGHTLAFIRDIDRARNAEDVSAKVLQYLSQFGVEYMVAATIPAPDANRRDQLGHLLLNRWPEEWASRYAARHYVAHDATIKRLMMSPEPFFWNELNPLVQDNPKARRVMDEATEFNLTEGFTLSLSTLDRQIVLFSVGGRHIELGRDIQGMLTLVANYAIGRAIMIKQVAVSAVSNKPIMLSVREREALQWAAEGKGDWEIGEVMNISEHGADKHMRSVREKLGAINRTQAVAEAIRRGLIA